MLHVWGLSIGTNHRRVWRDLGITARRKEAISFFWILPFHGKSSKSSEDLGTRVRPSKAKQECGGRDTKESLGGEGKSFGRLRGVDFVHWHSTIGVWDHTLSKCRRASGFGNDRCFSCLSSQQGKPNHWCFHRCIWHIQPEMWKDRCKNCLLYARSLCVVGVPCFLS